MSLGREVANGLNDNPCAQHKPKVCTSDIAYGKDQSEMMSCRTLLLIAYCDLRYVPAASRRNTAKKAGLTFTFKVPPDMRQRRIRGLRWQRIFSELTSRRVGQRTKLNYLCWP